MFRIRVKIVGSLCIIFIVLLMEACCPSSTSTVWNIDNLSEIGGNDVFCYGSPVVVSTEYGNAVCFDGIDDRMEIDSNPVGNSNEFTVEMVFWADSSFGNSFAPRFLQIQDPNDSVQKRIMIELRLTPEGKCYMDGFMKTDIERKALIDESFLHQINRWNHVAITYANDTLTTYFNGRKELQGKISYKDRIINAEGRTSLGGRMNNCGYFKGLILKVSVAQLALDSQDFVLLSYADTVSPFVRE